VGAEVGVHSIQQEFGVVEGIGEFQGESQGEALGEFGVLVQERLANTLPPIWCSRLALKWNKNRGALRLPYRSLRTK
jgi:hypothetical protein